MAKLGLDFAEVRDAAGNSINLRDHNAVSFADEVERSGELRTFGVDAGKLLAEHLLYAGRLQIAKLRLKTGHLLQRTCSCISDFHSMPFCLNDVIDIMIKMSQKVKTHSCETVSGHCLIDSLGQARVRQRTARPGSAMKCASCRRLAAWSLELIEGVGLGLAGR